jgi:small subunit ribosomal protein S17
MNKKTIEKSAVKNKCDDKNCPFHGSLRCRGKNFTGTVISTKMHKSAIVEWLWRKKIPKYERYENKRTKVKVHNPLCIDAQEGDMVKISECRPLSKTKNFVIVDVLGKEKGFKEKIEAREEAKVKKESKEEITEGVKKEE